MASVSGTQTYTSESSVLYTALSQSETSRSVGKYGAIDLPCLAADQFYQYLGEKITESNSGAQIFRVEGSLTPRIFKLIFVNHFDTGDEVRIAKRAAELKVAPPFHSACVVSLGEGRQVVVLEMDDAGLSLGKWMEKFGAEEAAAKEAPMDTEPEEILTEDEIAYQKMIEMLKEKFMAKCRYAVVSVKEAPAKVDLAVAVEKLWPSQEAFYFQLFSRVRELAENKIAFLDLHVGNIMPQPGSEMGMQLIDFGSAETTSSAEEAAERVITTAYGGLHFNSFSKLPNKSELSTELMLWFAPSMQRLIDWEKLSQTAV